MFRNKKSSVNPTLQKLAVNAPAVTSIASAGAAIGMATYWLVTAANAIGSTKASKSQQEKAPAEKKNQQ